MTAQSEPGVVSTRVARALPLVLAALLAVAAVGTVHTAGCDEPGRYVSTPAGISFVGGCVSPGDLHPMPGDGGDLADTASRRG
jgi:hypothetical protein